LLTEIYSIFFISARDIIVSYILKSLKGKEKYQL